jgi:nanoRNase/pAp phosphatase (c-di-AMP/oligoRNAs hydrolase)
MKTYVIYHANCLDGFGAAWAAWRNLRDGAEYIPINHGDPLPKLNTKSKVYLVDISFKRPVMEAMLLKHKHVTILDHHVTAENELKDFPNAKFDMLKSGAMLSWEFFNPEEEAPQLIKHIQDHDLWKFELENTKSFMAYLQTEPKDFDAWSGLAFKLQDDEEAQYMYSQGRAILKYQAQQIDMICSQSILDIDKNGIKFAKVNATTNWSEVGMKLLDIWPEAQYSQSFYLTNKKMWKYSLRSRGDFDVSNVALGHGGGGHKPSAGFISETFIND